MESDAVALPKKSCLDGNWTRPVAKASMFSIDTAVFVNEPASDWAALHVKAYVAHEVAAPR